MALKRSFNFDHVQSCIQSIWFSCFAGAVVVAVAATDATFQYFYHFPDITFISFFYYNFFLDIWEEGNTKCHAWIYFYDLNTLMVKKIMAVITVTIENN